MPPSYHTAIIQQQRVIYFWVDVMRKNTAMSYQLACTCWDEMALQPFGKLGRQEQAPLPDDLANYPLIACGTGPRWKASGRDGLPQA